MNPTRQEIEIQAHEVRDDYAQRRRSHVNRGDYDTEDVPRIPSSSTSRRDVYAPRAKGSRIGQEEKRFTRQEQRGEGLATQIQDYRISQTDPPKAKIGVPRSWQKTPT